MQIRADNLALPWEVGGGGSIKSRETCLLLMILLSTERGKKKKYQREAKEDEEEGGEKEKEADEDRIFRSHLTALRSVAPNGMSGDVAKQTNIDLQSVHMHTRTHTHTFTHRLVENTQDTST